MKELSIRENRRNLSLNCIHEFSWGFGVAFHSVYAVVPLFLKLLGAPDIVVISVAGLFTILIAIPQLFTAAVGRNIRNVKMAVIFVHLLTWPPIFMAGFTFAFMAPTGPQAWIFYYICFILYGLAIGIVLPIWTSFLQRATNRESRGTFFGISFAFNSLGGFFGGYVVKQLLGSNLPFPTNFGWGFLIMFFSIVIGTLVYLGYHIPALENHKPSRTFRQFFSETRSIIKTHRNFRRYLFSRMFFTANYPAVSLFAVYLQSKFSFDVSTAGVFTILNVVCFGMASFMTGKIGDKTGHVTTIAFTYSAYLAAVLTALLANSMWAVYLVFIFLGFGMGSFITASLNLVYDFAGDGDNKIYLALTDSILAPFVLTAILLAGLLNKIVDTSIVLGGIGAFIFIGLVLLVTRVKDPKHNPHEINLTSQL